MHGDGRFLSYPRTRLSSARFWAGSVTLRAPLQCYNEAVLDELLLPLFPLELVLLPEESLPLHIFEERYKQMISDCLDAEVGSGPQQFGIVMSKNEEINSIGCSARVVKVLRRYEDGRLDILTQGVRRFEVFLTNDEKAYLRAGVEFFDDDEGADLPPEKEARRALELFVEIRQLLGSSAEAIEDPAPPYRHLSFRIAAPLPVDPDFKQQLLAIRNEARRLREVSRAAQLLLPRLRAIQRARQKAGGNGHARGQE